jgi:ribosomal protein L11 methyltransferase
LLRFVGLNSENDSTFTIHIQVDPKDQDWLVADLWEAGTLGVVDEPGGVQAWFETEEAAARFGTPERVVNVDWVAKIEDEWPALQIGNKFFVVPPWNTDPTPPGRLRLEINPGIPFGTGRHPCTQKCILALEQVIKPGDSVLDVGSGSGILSIAAMMLGAGRVVACDIDADSSHPVAFFQGSVDAVRSGSFDVVVANINEDVIGSMLSDFERVAKTRILSGFPDENGEWACVVR